MKVMSKRLRLRGIVQAILGSLSVTAVIYAARTLTVRTASLADNRFFYAEIAAIAFLGFALALAVDSGRDDGRDEEDEHQSRPNIETD